MELYDRFFEDNSKRKDFSDRTIDIIDLTQATKIAIEYTVVPDLISKVDFVKIFKLIQEDLDELDKKQHRDYLDHNEFKKFLAAVGIHAYTEDERLNEKFPTSESKVLSFFKVLKC